MLIRENGTLAFIILFPKPYAYNTQLTRLCH